MFRAVIVTIVWLASLLADSVRAQQPPRIALVVTNQSYNQPGAALTNTHRDGELVQSALEKVGFKVFVARDTANEAALLTAIGEHVQRLAEAGPDAVGFVYYSGHGAADRPDGANYLIPTGAPITHAAQLPLMAVRLDKITETLARVGRINFVVFDACRNVPLQRAEKDVSFKGWAPVKEQSGLLVAYATEPGNVAIDQSIYARALAEEIVRPGREASSAFRAVARRVIEETANKQAPQYLDRRLHDFEFATAAAMNTPAPPPQDRAPVSRPTAGPQPTGVDAFDVEKVSSINGTLLATRQLTAVNAADPKPGIDTCAIACASTERCVAFEVNVVYSRCSLYSTFAGRKDLGGSISGVLKSMLASNATAGSAPTHASAQPQSFAYLQSTVANGVQIAAVQTTTQAACEMRCAASPGCVGFEFFGRSSRCTLFSRIVSRTRSSEPSAVVGERAGAAPIPVLTSITGQTDCRTIPVVATGSGRHCLDPGNAAKREFPECPSLSNGTQVCVTMTALPRGKYLRGSPASERGRKTDEEPHREVGIDVDIAMGKYEITRKQFSAFIGETGYNATGGCWVRVGADWKFDATKSWRDPGFEQDDNHPVTCVNWHDATAFAKWFSSKTNRPYRLPTEAEWEYAARAVTNTAAEPAQSYFAQSSEPPCDFANGADQSTAGMFSAQSIAACSDGHTYTAPVGRLKPNAFGLHDMLGNVNEWVQDCHRPSYDGVAADGTSAPDAQNCQRVVRGASWMVDPRNMRSAARSRDAPANRNYQLGFRLATTLGP